MRLFGLHHNVIVTFVALLVVEWHTLTNKFCAYSLSIDTSKFGHRES
jgi:hypothetical protein